MQLSINSRVVAIKEHVFCELDGEAVILNLDKCVYYGLNESSLAVWKIIQKPAFVWEIRDEMVDQFRVESASCESDILNLLGELKESSLLEIVSPSSAAT